MKSSAGEDVASLLGDPRVIVEQRATGSEMATTDHPWTPCEVCTGPQDCTKNGCFEARRI